MKKTIQINIGGSVFFIDEDAFQTLANYLEAIKQYLAKNEDRDEIIKDIELRIAELLIEKRISETHAISMHHIEEIIEVMGQPEDYRMDDDEEPVYTKKSSKKFFRDLDDRFIGGVSAGLAHYIGMDPVWMRLIWVLLVLAGFGSPILVYIILWIIVPGARTTSEKLQMKGEPVNLSNIEKTLKKEYDNVAQKVKDADIKGKTQSLKKKSARFFDWLLKVGKIAVRVILFTIGVVLLIVSFVSIFGIVLSFILPGVTTMPFIEDVNFASNLYWVFHIAFGLSLIIPFVFLFILSLYVINPKMNQVGKLTKTSLFLVWILAVATAIFVYYNMQLENKYTGRSLQHSELPLIATDTLRLKVKQHPTLSHIRERGKYLIQKDSLGKDFVYGYNFLITIKPTNESEPSLVIKKSANGSDLETATNLAEKIDYAYQIEENKLILNDYFFLYGMKQNHNAMINVYLNLPEGMLFTIDSDASKKIKKNHRNDRLVPDEYLQLSNDAVICVSCPVEQKILKEIEPSTDWEERVDKAFEEVIEKTIIRIEN